MNGPQVLHVNSGCLKCLSDINLSLAIRSLFTIAFILYFQKKIFAMFESLRIGTFVTVNLHNNILASCSLINFNVLLSHTVHFDKIIILPVLVSTTFGFFTFCIFSTLQTIR